MSVILISGATGFIGSALYERLKHNHHVHKLVRYVAGRFNFYADDLTHFADLRDSDSVRRVVLSVKPDIVIHLAAQSAVAYSFENPEEVAKVNTLGTLAVAEALLETRRGHMIHASSSEVYGHARHFPTPEDEPTSAISPYAVSKIAAEHYLRVLHETKGLHVTIMRPFNTFGRALVKNRHFVVERAITQALTSGKITLHDPSPLRDFMFREDHVDAYVRAVAIISGGLAENLDGQTINITTGQCYSIREMANEVARLVEQRRGTPVSVEFSEVPDRPLDIERLYGDNSKAKELLGWWPQYSLEAGLEKAIEEWAQALNT